MPHRDQTDFSGYYIFVCLITYVSCVVLVSVLETLQSVKRKLEVESNATERVEGSVKDAEDHLNAKDYDLQQMLQQLEALKCRQA